MPSSEPEEQAVARAAGPGPHRWVCRCAHPPILLATHDDQYVNLKVRDRYYHLEAVQGRLHAICPRCGTQHTLVLGGKR